MKNVLLLLADGFETYEASVFIDVIGWNLVDGDGTTRLWTGGLRREVKSSFNQLLNVDYTVDDICVDRFDALAVPGGFEEYDFYRDAYDERFLELIRAFHRQEKLIATICVGALPVGKSGILQGKNGTTYNGKNGIRQEKLREYGVNVLQEPIVVDDHVITSWNPATALNVAFLLLENLTSKKNTDMIKSMMGFE